MVSILLLLMVSCLTESAPEAPTVQAAPALNTPNPAGPGQARHVTPAVIADARIEAAQSTLESLVRTHAADPTNPWAIGHGLVALGPGLVLTNGADAIDWLFASYAEHVSVEGRLQLRFPEHRGPIRIEPHPDLLLKALADAGVNHQRIVQAQGHKHPISDLYQNTLADHPFPTKGTLTPTTANDVPWSLFALASWSPMGTTWTDANGHQHSLDDVTDKVGSALTEATDFLSKAKASGAGFAKRKQGIFAFTCGGAHLIQGVLHARLRGFGSAAGSAQVQEQLDLLAYRFPIELAAIDAGLASHPEFAIPLLIQRLKLAGHTLETYARVSAWGGTGAPTASDLLPYATAVANSVSLLAEAGAFETIDAIKETDTQRYLDIVGDSAHALRGLRIALGKSPVYY
jgi:hypothetical protein